MIFMIIFTNIGYITQIFIAINIVIDIVISSIKRYKPLISCIRQAMINFNTLI